MRKTMIYAIIVIGILIIGFLLFRYKPAPTLMTTDASTPEPKGDRILGIDVTAAEDNDFDKAFQLTKSAGSQVATLSLNWKDIEKLPRQYEDPGGALAIANSYYPLQQMQLAMYIRSVDTLAKMTPADLQDTPFSNSVMAERYIKMIEWVFSQIPDVELQFLSIGDEIDIMMGNNKELYREFEVFFKKVKPGIKVKKPNLKVSFSATLSGLTSKVPAELKSINQASDIVLVSYYPLNDDSSVKNPSLVSHDYNALVKVYPGRTIYIEQTGYPTGALLRSSEAKQRDFIKETFKAWDKHGKQIKYVSFTWLHDLSQETIEFYKQYYGSSDPKFLEFLQTLGLRTNPGSGQDKKAFQALKAEAKARGW